MQNISVYLNPLASNTGYDYWTDRLSRSLFRSQLAFRSPEGLDQLAEYIAEDLENKVDAIFSVGGDGTVNTMIQHLAGKDVGLLVVPGGTANDLANELGIGRGIDRIIQAVRRKSLKEIDLIQVGNRYMATNGGIGLGGEVAQKVNSLRAKFPLFKKLMGLSGKRIYSLFVAGEVIGQKIERYNLNLVSSSFAGQVNCLAVLINNQPMLAGTFKIAPETNNTDGKFNVTVLTHPNKQSFIQCLLQVASGHIPKNDPYFKNFETDHLIIENLNPKRKLNFFGDGETFEDAEDLIEIKVLKKGLKVFCFNPEQDLVDLVNEVTLQ